MVKSNTTQYIMISKWIQKSFWCYWNSIGRLCHKILQNILISKSKKLKTLPIYLSTDISNKDYNKIDTPIPSTLPSKVFTSDLFKQAYPLTELEKLQLGTAVRVAGNAINQPSPVVWISSKLYCAFNETGYWNT